MEIVNIKVKDIIPYENNPRLNDEAVQYVANSIKEFGFKVPIIIDKNNVIVAGHTRLKSAELLGLKEVPCIRADDLTDQQVKAFRLADNKVAEKAGWDYLKLDSELADITFDMTEFGFDAEVEQQFDYGSPNADQQGALTRKFGVPPFSVLDARQGYWNDRKRFWKDLIQDKGQARENAKPLGTAVKGFEDASILDPVLSEVVNLWFTPKEKGNKTFDCFAGDTVFGYVSSFMGNKFTGIELRQEQADFNNERTKELNAHYICDDGRNVCRHIEEESQDLLFSCPPYFDLEVYSDLENDASNQETYEDFYKILDEAFSNACRCLKQNRFAVIVVGNIRDKNGAYYDFTGDIKRTFEKNGLALYNEAILVTPVGSASLKASRHMRTRKLVSTHQYVLIFYKGDTNKVKEHFYEIEGIDDYAGEDMELE